MDENHFRHKPAASHVGKVTLLEKTLRVSHSVRVSALYVGFLVIVFLLSTSVLLVFLLICQRLNQGKMICNRDLEWCGFRAMSSITVQSAPLGNLHPPATCHPLRS
jgi:hypothetical protein